MNILIDEIGDNNGKIHNCIHRFRYSSNYEKEIEISILVYKMRESKINPGPILMASIYYTNQNDASESIGDIYLDGEDEILKIIKSKITNYETKDIINHVQNYAERVCHEIAPYFGYSKVEFI